MQETLSISIAIISKDEEKNIKDCLVSVSFAKQIVVIDSGSRDNTITIAKDFGCEVYSEGWYGFGAQKQMAINRCHEQWILLLDADERVSPEMAEQIERMVNSGGNAHGYSFPRKNFFVGGG